MYPSKRRYHQVALLAAIFLVDHQVTALLRAPQSTTIRRSKQLFATSWQDYQNYNPLLASFERDGGILYKTSVLTPLELSTIQNEVTKLMVKDETTSSVARNRMGAILPNDSDTVRILRDGSLMTNIISKLGGATHYTLSTDIPIELRIYEKYGAGMDWHVDDVLFDPSPQLEVVLTLENTSDCQTMWKSAVSTTAIETDVNSVLLLRAGGVPHCVSSLKRGRRAILKCAYVETDSVFRTGEMVNQFAAAGGGSKKKKKKKKR